jgi:hypothetical protein
MATLVLVVLTLLLAWRSVPLDLTARSRLLQGLEADSEAFKQFRTLTESPRLAKRSKLLRMADLTFRVLVTVPLIALLLLSITPFGTPLLWLVALGIFGLILLILNALAYIWTRNKARINDLATELDPLRLTKKNQHGALGFLIFSVQAEIIPLIMVGSLYGTFLGLLNTQFATFDEVLALSVAVIDAGIVLLWFLLVTPYRRGAEGRLFEAFRNLKANPVVSVDPYYSSGGKVVGCGQLWGIGDSCQVRGPNCSMSGHVAG